MKRLDDNLGEIPIQRIGYKDQLLVTVDALAEGGQGELTIQAVRTFFADEKGNALEQPYQTGLPIQEAMGLAIKAVQAAEAQMPKSTILVVEPPRIERF